MSSFMTASIIVSAFFFAAITIWQFGRFEATMKSPTGVEDVWLLQTVNAQSYSQQFELARTRAAFALERELIARRYDQANLTLTTRLWTRLMGFLTGMIVALVGAVFVLGKLSEDVSEAAAKAGVPGHEWSFSFRSASPGLVMVVMGTVLMALSITIQATYDAQDAAIYFGRTGPGFVAPEPPPTPPPPDARQLASPDPATKKQP